MKNYKSIRKTLNTFDIVCCEHKDLFWKLIGHTAMVVRDKEKDINMVWQSTTQYANQKGTSLSFFNEWLDQYPGKVYIRKVIMPDAMREDAEIMLDAYIKKYRDRPYPNLHSLYGLRYMYNIVVDWLPWTENKPEPINDARCCSDRIAHTLQTCGLLSENMNPSEQEPDNFRDYVPFHKPVDYYCNPGVIIMPEVRIK
jgi:hypothetical protein